MLIQGKVSVDVNVIEIKELIQADAWVKFVDGLSDGTAVLTARQERKVKRVSENKYKQASKTKEQAATSIEESCKAVPATPITTKVEKVEAVSKSEVNPVVASSEDDYLNQVVDFEALKQKVKVSIAFDETNQDHKDAANTVIKTYHAKHNLSGSKFTMGQVLDIVELIREAIFGPDEDDDQYDDEE